MPSGGKKVSTSSGGKRTRPQVHQNTTAFHHNPSSKMTAKIMASPISSLLCPACVRVIEWRKQYRKYKPLTVPKKCIGCDQKRIKAAYHTRCDACASASSVCAKCGDSRSLDEQKAKAPITPPVSEAEKDEEERSIARESAEYSQEDDENKDF
jgi:hypothetical protein